MIYAVGCCLQSLAVRNYNLLPRKADETSTTSCLPRRCVIANERVVVPPHAGLLAIASRKRLGFECKHTLGTAFTNVGGLAPQPVRCGFAISSRQGLWHGVYAECLSGKSGAGD